ncbi:MAG: D-alanine--D-alanine ligase family protein [Acidobacteriota bacterium]
MFPAVCRVRRIGWQATHEERDGLKIDKVFITHNAVPEGADPSTADVLDEVDFVVGGLGELRIAHEIVPVTDGKVWEALRPQRRSVVVNLVESPPGAPHLQVGAAAVLEVLGLPFTGSGSAALWLTTDKIATRALLAANGVPVAEGGRFSSTRRGLFERVPPPWILKAGREDSSVGLDGEEVVFTNPVKAFARGRDLERRFPDQPILVEHYLPGREFNIGVIEVSGRPRVLPIAEMTFKNYPEGKPKIVDFGAKWVEGTFSWDNTERRFLEDGEDLRLTRKLATLARDAWRVTHVSGYARVDVRLDDHGNPAVLEVNANPCITQGSGMTVAAQRAGMSDGQVVRHMLSAALRRNGHRRST